MTINIFILKGDLNGQNRSGAFLFLLGIFHLKMTCTSCTNEVREKVPSFQKVTLFPTQINVFACLKMLLASVIQEE